MSTLNSGPTEGPQNSRLCVTNLVDTLPTHALDLKTEFCYPRASKHDSIHHSFAQSVQNLLVKVKDDIAAALEVIHPNTQERSRSS